MPDHAALAELHEALQVMFIFRISIAVEIIDYI